jgi:hypothetical protein
MRIPYWRIEPRGYASRSPRLVSGENTGVFVVMGQSNGAAYGSGSLITPTNASKVDTLSIFDGGMYEGKDPGPNMDGLGTSWLYRLADRLIPGNFYDRVIMLPIAMGSALCIDYTPGGVLEHFGPVAHRRCAALDIPISGFLWQQGEGDGGMGTAAYKALLQSVIDTTREAGSTAPWFIGKSTYSGGVTSATVRAACAEIVDNVDIFAGADTDTLTGAYRSDGVHFNETGCIAAAGLWQSAITAVL